MISVEMILKMSKILESTSPITSQLLSYIKIPITTNEFFNLLGFPELPKLIPYKKDNIEIGKENSLHEGIKYQLLIGNNQWMTFNSVTFLQFFEFYSHHNLAKGHCICTGLGFGLREKWLLSKKEVSKITVLEKNIEVINYHKELNPDLISQLEVINCDASEYTGKCDTLLLDHYELEPDCDKSRYFENIKRCCDNIDHSMLWFWPLESVVTNNMENTDYYFSKKRYQNYLNLLKIYPTLPSITENELNSYCDMYYFYNRPLSSIVPPINC